MKLFCRGRPRLLCLLQAACHEPAQIWSCQSIFTEKRKNVERFPQAIPHPKPSAMATHRCLTSQPCSAQPTVLLQHNLLKQGPNQPSTSSVKDVGFLSQKYLLTMDPIPCLGFSLQTVTSISGSFLRTRLNLVLFSVQADFDSSSHGGLSHVLRHLSSFSRARVNGSQVSAAACTSEAICLHTEVLCKAPAGCSYFLLA